MPKKKDKIEKIMAKVNKLFNIFDNDVINPLSTFTRKCQALC